MATVKKAKKKSEVEPAAVAEPNLPLIPAMALAGQVVMCHQQLELPNSTGFSIWQNELYSDSPDSALPLCYTPKLQVEPTVTTPFFCTHVDFSSYLETEDFMHAASWETPLAFWLQEHHLAALKNTQVAATFLAETAEAAWTCYWYHLAYRPLLGVMRLAESDFMQQTLVRSYVKKYAAFAALLLRDEGEEPQGPAKIISCRGNFMLAWMDTLGGSPLYNPCEVKLPSCDVRIRPRDFFVTLSELWLDMLFVLKQMPDTPGKHRLQPLPFDTNPSGFMLGENGNNVGAALGILIAECCQGMQYWRKFLTAPHVAVHDMFLPSC